MLSHRRPRGTVERVAGSAAVPIRRGLLQRYFSLMGELNHECGVAAVYHAAGAIVSPLTPIPGDVNSVARLIPRMLLDMQNRGQLAAGMTSYNPQRPSLLETHKEAGDRRGGVPAQPSRRSSKTIMRGLDGPAGDRPCPLRHLRRGRSELRSAVRTRARPQDQVVRLRLQRPARELSAS